MRDMTALPRVTYALIAVNVAAFLAEGNLTFSSGGALGGAVYDKGALIGSTEYPPFAGQGVAHGQWWRLVTSGFLHENLLHIGMNMLVLYLLGRMLEPAMGSMKFAVVYGVSLLAGSFGALLLSPHTFTVGASGAIFGIAGAAAVEMRARQIPIMQSGIGGLILINLIFSFSVPGISIGGHIGGLIGGALAALAIQFGERSRSLALGLAACVAIAAASVVGGIATSKSSEVEPQLTENVFVTPGQ
jgi:membrane associated rhomboid family serine protease